MSDLSDFQIRGALGRHPTLRLRVTPSGNLVLSEEGADVLDLGSPEDALLVSKCIEVAARSEVSGEFVEATGGDVEQALEQIKANHDLAKTEP